MTDSGSQSSRFNEITEILAAGFLRVLERKSSQNLLREAKTSLDCKRKRRGDVEAKAEDISP